MNPADEKLLEDNGWEVDCYSPLEIRTKDGSFASGEAADIVLNYLKYESITKFGEQDMHDSFNAGINRGINIAAMLRNIDIGETYPTYQEFMKRYEE